MGLLAGALLTACKRSDRIRVGSKNFSESVLLGEILTQHLRRQSFDVEHASSLGGTFVCHQAMLSGDLDVYVEYTGTALVAVLRESPQGNDPDAVHARVTQAYKDKFGIVWLPALGFDDSFAVLVRKQDADALGLAKISDLAAHPKLRPGFGYEFVERTDGWKSFAATYALHFEGAPTTMDLGLTYKALADGKVDLIAGNATSGLIDKLGLVELADDKRFFPPYDAAPLIRKRLADQRPDVPRALGLLAGKMTTKDIRAMNRRIDVEGEAPAEVARQFLDRLALGVASRAGAQTP
jgi:glycine betaine/choline ABC-type transport system substrate-binding protein